MFLLYANKTQLDVIQRERITSGSVNVYQARFDFSEDWNGLERTVVFIGSGKTISILLDGSGECVIPWEVLTKSGRILEAGVYGTRNGEVVLPTVKANLGIVLAGVSPGEEASRLPTPERWEQALARKGDKLQYTEEGALGLYAGDKLLSAVPAAGGGGENGTTDHCLLHHRDAADQHPIESISGLREELDKARPAETLTIAEILRIMGE